MYIELPRHGIRINIFVPVGALFLLLLNGVLAFTVMLLAVVVHELGHILAAKLCKAHICRFDIELWGGKLQYEGFLSYKQELFIALGGIILNTLTAPLGLLLGLYGRLFFYSSLCYAAVNAIPAPTLDGAVALSCILRIKTDIRSAMTAERTVEVFSLFVLVAVGSIFCILSGLNSSVLFLCALTVVVIIEPGRR